METTSQALDQLATALAAAQAKMGNAAFNRVNPHFKSKYADLAAIREATLPALTANGLAIVQYTSAGADGEIWLTTKLLHKSGQSIEGTYPIARGTPQQMGSALTYAKRYSWSAMCGVAADDDDDANAAEGLPATNARGQGAGKSKANSRADYETLSAGLRGNKSSAELQRWYSENVDKINALPGDWIDILRTEYTDHLADLKKTDQTANAKRRSEGKPYGVKEQLKDSLDAEDAEVDDELRHHPLNAG